MRYFLILPVMGILSGMLLLSACRPIPKVPAESQELPGSASSASTPSKASGQQPGLGSFNIHKRHGLGGWEGAKGPSEQELLQQMRSPSDNAASPHKSLPARKEPH